MDGRRLRAWTVTLPPGETKAFVAAEWADTLVVVEEGELEVECRSGRCERFAAGSVLTFAGLPVRRFHNRGSTRVRLAAVTRRRGDGPMTD